MTVKRVAIVWRNAIIAVARRRGLAALDARMLAWLEPTRGFAPMTRVGLESVGPR